jgi:hypothetical protein
MSNVVKGNEQMYQVARLMTIKD